MDRNSIKKDIIFTSHGMYTPSILSRIKKACENETGGGDIELSAGVSLF